MNALRICALSLLVSMLFVFSYAMYLADTGGYVWPLVVCFVCVVSVLAIDTVTEVFKADSLNYEKPFWDRRVTHRRSHSRPRHLCFFRMHRLEAVRDTGVLLYRECPHCLERTVTHYARAWHPVDTQWLLTGQFSKRTSQSVYLKPLRRQ